MKHIKSIISLLLAFLFLIFFTLSCAPKDNADDDSTKDSTKDSDIKSEDTEAETEEVPVMEQKGRQVEKLNRGIVAFKTDDGIMVSWRSFGTESNETVYELFRDGELIYKSEAGMPTSYLDKDAINSGESPVYSVSVDGADAEECATVYSYNYFDIDIDRPEGGKTPAGEAYTYFPGDASCGDLDGDGEYEIVLKWDPSNAKDNAHDGYTGNVILDAYKLDGTKLWRIDLGKNIRAGAHYTQFLVYDFDGNGMAEVVCKTSDGTVDGMGNMIGKDTDYRSGVGRILQGREFLTVFDGLTGGEIVTEQYKPQRGSVDSWGDGYGNRCDRFLAAVAYLDGKTPSIVMCRGYYTRSVLVAYTFDGKNLNETWTFDTNKKYGNYAGQGNHNLCVADVDGDGFDEIVYGQCCIDHDGTGLWCTGLGHGDAIHVGDFLPKRDGLEVWGCLEGSQGAYLADAKTGEVLFTYKSDRDVGRALADNFIRGNDSAEFMCATTSTVYYAKDNEKVRPVSNAAWSGGLNFAVWWTDKLERCGLDGTKVFSYELGNVLNAKGVTSINGTKSTPCLTADLFGDWREEIVFAKTDGSGLRVYFTDFETDHRIYTLMHNTMYRCGVANENVAYNIPPHTDFFLDSEYPLPEYPEVYSVGSKKY